MNQLHTGLLSPTCKNSISQVPPTVEAPREILTTSPSVVLRRPYRVDNHGESPSGSSSQGEVKSASERASDGKALGTTSDGIGFMVNH
jgi:hypothetical protein